LFSTKVTARRGLNALNQEIKSLNQRVLFH
jgi:hypothetical protein